DYGSLSSSASSAITGTAPRYLSATVVIRNPTSKMQEVDYGGCGIGVRLFRSADRSGSPAWRSELRKAPGSMIVYPCASVLSRSTLFPGDSIVFPLVVPMVEVVGDTLAAGHYYASAEMKLEGKQLPDGTTKPGVTITLVAGEVDITRDSERLPSSRVID